MERFKALFFWFALLLLFELLIASCLFFIKIGFLPQNMTSYYFGNDSLFINPKTIDGIWPTATAHIVAIGVLIFGLSHSANYFLKKVYIVKLGTFSAVFGILNSIGGLIILTAGVIFVYFKIISFLLFIVTAIYLSVFFLVRAVR